MTKISVTLEKEAKKIKIIPLGDVHKGSPQFIESLFLKVINTIRDTPNCYTILMGDLIDNVLKSSKGNIYLATESPSKSIEWLVEKLKPIKDKILAVTIGNHEGRTLNEVGVDILCGLVEKLGLKDRYAPGPFILFLKINKEFGHVFTIYGAHGASTGTTQGAIANKLISLGNTVVDADIYLMGHGHKPMILFDPCYTINSIRRSYKKVDRLFVCSPSFLDYEGGYGEQKLYKPTSNAVPIIELESCHKNKSISVNNMK